MLKEFLNILLENTGVDFCDYKPTTLQRRIIRRMHLLDIASENDYLNYLLKHEQEQHLLYKEMLIHVTTFFRDETSFDYLCSEVIPAILKSKNPNDIVRIWVCGCATGEEAYSIAICFHEHLQQVGDLTRIKIFASDLSEAVIAKARKGVYPATALAKLSEARKNVYFFQQPDGYHIRPFIREMCTFAVHNVLQNPPFANIDLLSCRNVLIYMQPVLQKKVLATFSYSLRENGYLFLGKSETSGLAGKFETVNKGANIYTNRERNTKLFSIHSATKTPPADMSHTERPISQERKDFQRAADEMLLAKYIPAGVVVNDSYDIVDFRGNTGFYIEPSPGIASWNVLKMIRKGLYYDLQEALGKAKAERVSVRREGIALEHEGALQRINLEVQPLSGTKEKYYLVLFQQVPQAPADSLVTDDGINNTRDLRIHQLEQELMHSREQLRALSEEQEATSEEFQSANEELKTLNEELQTSQEELISINEEVTQRNKELNSLNKELVTARNFASSINNTINDSLLILDKHLRVQGANRAFYETFHINETDAQDRVVYELGNKQWNIPELRQLLEQTLPEKKEVSDFLLKHKFETLGYRALLLNVRQMHLEAAAEPLLLVVIQDITESHELQQAVHESAFRLQFAFDTAGLGTWEVSLPDRTLSSSDRFKQTLGLPTDAPLTYEGLLAMLVEEDRAEFQEVLSLAPEQQRFSKEFRVLRADGSQRWLALSGMARLGQQGTPISVLGVSADITERKRSEQKLRSSEQHFRLLADSAPVMIAMSGENGEFSFYNKSWLNFTGRGEGYTAADWVQDIHPDDRSKYESLFQSSLKTQARFNAEFRLRHKGRYRWLSCIAVPRFNVKEGFDGYTMACTDVHDQKLMSEALERKVEERTEALRDMNDELLDKNRELEQFAYVTSHDLQEPLRKILMFSSVLLRKNEPERSTHDAEYLTRIEQAASRMIHLIQDLLNYSSLKEHTRDFLPTDLNKIVQHVLIDFDLLIQEKEALLTIGSLPTVDAVPLQMTQLFYNLISNALKFSRLGVRPEIRIAATELTPDEAEAQGLKRDSGYSKIEVSDNGIGFDKSYSDRIFEIFQRLHAKDQYQGNGIGLALCRKIVQSHRGALIPHSEEGAGTTFAIILPLKQDA